MWEGTKFCFCDEQCFYLNCFLIENLQIVFDELFNMLDHGEPAFIPKKGIPNVMMFVGLKGELPAMKACLGLRFACVNVEA